MLNIKKLGLGKLTQSRAALIIFAAAAFTAATASEASARSHRHHHHHAAKAENSSWGDAGAAISSAIGRSFSGVASFYGNESGHQTASGQRFNQEAMTAAHRTLPFGTKLRVTHGSRSVVVTINDRGPYIRGRVLDLSTGAARAIGLTSAGIGHVTAEVIS
jgi:rare lipoprotein A